MKRYGEDESPIGTFKVTGPNTQVPQTQAQKERSWTLMRVTGSNIGQKMEVLSHEIIIYTGIQNFNY